MHPVVLIPARMASTRLPDKPLALIKGEPMIVHVWRRAVAAKLGDVAVACDGERIADAIVAAGGVAVITDPDLPSGSDRIWQALQKLDPEGRYDTVVNLQGDMPTLDPALVGKVASLLAQKDVDIGTLAAKITDPHEVTDPAVVKAVFSHETGKALYFSREAIPYGAGDHYHHIGIYAYRREALQRFVNLPPSILELREKLEQLRAMEAGFHIRVAVADTVPLGVDTEETLEKARKAYES